MILFLFSHGFRPLVDSFPRFETVNLEPTEEFIVNFTGDLKTFMVTREKKIELPVCSDSTYEYVFENGFDGKNILSDTTVNVSKTIKNTLTKDEDGFYLIHNGKELSYFRDLVNSGNNKINARLTNDIDMSEETAKDSSWVGFGIYDYRGPYLPYIGTFDGMGYTISNIYQKSQDDYNGLFGYIENSTIRNVEIKSSFFSGLYVGAFVGYSINSDIINCGTESEIFGYSDYPACGILSKGKDSEITNCFSISKIFGEFQPFGITGYDNENCTIANCYSSSKINSNCDVHAFNDFDSKDSVQHCFYDSTLFFSSLNEDVYVIDTKTAALPVTTEQIKSSGFLDEMNAWVDSMNAIQDTIVYAKWIRDEKDGYPKFSSSNGTDNYEINSNKGVNADFLVYSANQTLYIKSSKAGSAILYNELGQAILFVKYDEGLTAVDGLSKGIYFIKGEKVVIR